MGFRTARDKARKTLLDVQKEMGVSAVTIHNWEIGAYMPRADKLKQLAEFYGCTVDELLEPDEQEGKRMK